MTATLFDIPASEDGEREERTEWGVRWTRTIPHVVTAGQVDPAAGEEHARVRHASMWGGTCSEVVSRTVVTHTTDWEVTDV